MPVRHYEGVNLDRIRDRDIRAALNLIDLFCRSVPGAIDEAAAAAGSGGGGGGAPVGSSFITVVAEAGLTAERSLAVSAPITKSDGGADSTMTLGASLGVPAFTFGTVASAGVDDTLVRRDAGIALFDTTVPADTGAASAGVAGVPPRRDHVHRVDLSAAGGVAGVLTTSFGGTSASTPGQAFTNLAPTTTLGDLIVHKSTGSPGRLGVGADTLRLTAFSGDALNGVAYRSINDLTADASPDGAADYVETWDASASTHKKVLLDNLPGGGGSTEFNDDVFRVRDNADTTKKLALECSGITIATTRTITVPNYDGRAALKDTTNNDLLDAEGFPALALANITDSNTVNVVQARSGTTGNGPTLQPIARGTGDANIDLRLSSIGPSGKVLASSGGLSITEVVTYSSVAPLAASFFAGAMNG